MRGHVVAVLALVLFPGLGVATPLSPCVFAGAEPVHGEAEGLVLCTAPV